MKKIGLSIAILALLASMSCKEKKTDKNTDDKEMVGEDMKESEMKMDDNSISFILESKSESTATGKVNFTETDGIVKLDATFSGLKPGTHAIHIHEKADCSSPDGKSTGGHWNPTIEKHGKWGDPTGYHKGDIGNIVVGDDGMASLSMQTDEWCIGCGDANKDIVGKAIIVHQGTDDFVSQPTGDAGGRVSCGGIIK